MEATEKERFNKIFSIVKSVLGWVLVAVTTFMMVFTLISVNLFNRNSLFGIRIYTVLSDSMSATDFSAGDIIFVKEKKDYTNLSEGDIISYISLNSESYGEIVTHKIRNAEYDKNGELIGYITYGTTTGVDDETIVAPEYIQGVYTGRIPKIGYFFQFIRTTVGYIVCILIPFSLLILWQVITCVRLFRRYKAEQMEELNAEKEKLEKERNEIQGMMAELLELKAKLQGGESVEGSVPQSVEGSVPQSGESIEKSESADGSSLNP